METFDQALYPLFTELFHFPDPSQGRFVQDGTLGLIELATEWFRYDREVGYAFETAAMCASEGGGRLFFVRIHAWDPKYRNEHPEIDYCIPIAYDGASEREKVTRRIPFGGAWSDTWEAALIVLDERWVDWLARLDGRMAFANPNWESAALFKLQERDHKKLTELLGACRP